MRVLFDTNVVIDAAVPARRSHEVALRLMSEVDRGRISGLVAPTSLATCWYVATSHHEVDPRPLFETLEAVFDFALMNRAPLRAALDADPETDFEDVDLAAAGKEAGAEIVVTRNEQDFTGGPLTPSGRGVSEVPNSYYPLSSSHRYRSVEARNEVSLKSRTAGTGSMRPF